MTNTISGKYRNDTGPLTTTYTQFSAEHLRYAFREQYREEEGVDIMMAEGQHKITTKGSKIIDDGGYLAGGEGYDLDGNHGGDMVIVALQTNASADTIIAYAIKTRKELGDDFETYRRAFRGTMTDEIWASIQGWFSTTLTITTAGKYTTISDGSRSVIIDLTTHAMKYGAGGLWTDDTSIEYSTIENNGWLVDGVYTYGGINQDRSNTVASIIDKSKIVFTINVSTDGQYTTITKPNTSGGIVYNTSTGGLRRKASYYAEEQDATILSSIASEGRLVDGVYNYSNNDNKESVWNAIYEDLRVLCISNATITHDVENGEITLANGEWSMTIADKNVGATEVRNDGDSVTTANVGNIFQWGNNYGFPPTGVMSNTSSTQVDASSYGPGNYYSSDIFITTEATRGRDSSNNNDLWGDVTNTEIARQGPCDNGYHIPSASERQELNTFYFTIRPASSSYFADLKLPGVKGIKYDNNGFYAGRYYWTSSAGSSSYNARGAADEGLNYISLGSSYNRAFGYSIRPFKNTTPSA